VAAQVAESENDVDKEYPMGDPIHDVAADNQPQPVPPAPHISPKVKWPAVTLVALGVLVLVLDQLGVIDVDDTLWIALLGGGGGAGAIGYRVDDPADTR
jgi:hypothetical protein